MQLLKDFTSFLKSAKKPLPVVLGPTASGKTTLSIKLAQLYNGEIISVDSRQIYQQMPIATDLVPQDKRQNIPHHLLEITPPDQTLTLTDITAKALATIDQIYQSEKLPIIAGGTGLYIDAIIQQYNMPQIPPKPELRAQLEQEVKIKGPLHLHQKLTKLDPEAASKIHPNNTRYVIRALEINLTTGRNKCDLKSQSPFDAYLIGIDWPRDQLYQRINQRVDEQIQEGLIDEVKALLNQGYTEDLPSMSSLGIKEVIPYIKGEQSLEEATDQLKQNTRNYAKRQLTWFRRYDNVHWLTPQQLEEILSK